jgi:hypothetical protein
MAEGKQKLEFKLRDEKGEEFIYNWKEYYGDFQLIEELDPDGPIEMVEDFTIEDFKKAEHNYLIYQNFKKNVKNVIEHKPMVINLKLYTDSASESASELESFSELTENESKQLLYHESKFEFGTV